MKNIAILIKKLVDSELSTKPSKPLEVKCPVCKETYSLQELGKQDFEFEKEIIEQTGECSTCDHLRSDNLI